MSLFVASLNSGSNGNCYYIGNHTEAILVDAGISCREIGRRMKRLGLSMLKVKAVFVSHEHTDHVKGICGLVKKYRLPIFITMPTLLNCNFSIEQGCINSFDVHDPVMVGSLLVKAFSKFHDAADPYSFTITCGGITVGVFTDIGTPCSNLTGHFRQCHAAFLEANYDEAMLETGNYPWHLKRRISGGYGHLSNNEALALFTRHRPSFMSHLFLSHLSKNNNCPQLVKDLFVQHANGVEIVVASRYEETAVYDIGQVADKATKNRRHAKASAPQLQFAFG